MIHNQQDTDERLLALGHSPGKFHQRLFLIDLLNFQANFEIRNHLHKGKKITFVCNKCSTFANSRTVPSPF